MSIHSQCATVRETVRNESCRSDSPRSATMADAIKTQGAVEAMEVAEASRETEWEKPSFVGDLFLGKLNLDLIHPFPEQPAADKAEADGFLTKLERFLAENVDPEKI